MVPLLVLILIVAVTVTLIVGLANGLGSRFPWRIGRLGWTPWRVHYLPGVMMLEGDNRWRHVVAGLHVRTDRTGGATNDSYHFPRGRR